MCCGRLGGSRSADCPLFTQNARARAARVKPWQSKYGCIIVINIIIVIKVVVIIVVVVVVVVVVLVAVAVVVVLLRTTGA